MMKTGIILIIIINLRFQIPSSTHWLKVLFHAMEKVLFIGSNTYYRNSSVYLNKEFKSHYFNILNFRTDIIYQFYDRTNFFRSHVSVWITYNVINHGSNVSVSAYYIMALFKLDIQHFLFLRFLVILLFSLYIMFGTFQNLIWNNSSFYDLIEGQFASASPEMYPWKIMTNSKIIVIKRMLIKRLHWPQKGQQCLPCILIDRKKYFQFLYSY